jgi:uracil-DNA glycosylase
LQDNFRNLLLNYFRQKAEQGEKVVYRSFDSTTILDNGFESADMPSADNSGILSIDDFAQTDSLGQLYDTIKDCQKCALGATRTKFVFGVGNPHAEIMFIGEAPGHDEDIKGEPFVGRAGQLLNKGLVALGIDRSDVYITNILKCRPPNNRDPLPEEAELCEPYLVHQIKLIQPRIICCLGRIAAQRLLRVTMTLGQMRERWYNFAGVPLMVTYHPAAALRSPDFKRPLWDDLKKMMAKVKELRGREN